MGKNKKNKKKGVGKEKTLLKTEKNAKKKALKNLKKDEEEDIEQLIEQFKKMDAEKVAITEEVVGLPPPRVNCTIVVNPLKDGEFVMFGGEFFDGANTFVYNELFSHQAVVYKNFMYVFGGEFTSPSQNQFYHYKDLWRLNLETFAWEQLTKDVKGTSPSARSGHRMVIWKHKLILFGGFYDTLTETKYHNDLHILDLDTNRWQKIEFASYSVLPNPRSGFQMTVYENTLYLFGGYSKEKAKQYGEPKGVVHTDMWSMNLNEPKLAWSKVKKSGVAPSPRSGMSGVTWNKKLIVFGGVFDEEDNDGNMKSTFYNEMYLFQLDSKRWFPISLHIKAPKKGKKEKKEKKEQQVPEGKMEEEDELEEEDNLEMEMEKNDEAKMETRDQSEENKVTPKGQSEENKAAPMGQSEENKVAPMGQSEETKAEKVEKPEGTPELPQPLLPSPRINSSLFIVNNILYVYGGIYETEKREVTLNDMFALNLHKMDTFVRIFEGDTPTWLGEETDDEEEEEGSDSESEGEEGEESSDEEGEEKSKPVKFTRGQKEELQKQLLAFQKDNKPVANMNESLREFFERTAEFWTKEAYEMAVKNGSIDLDEKSLRRSGFALSEVRWNELRPVLSGLEQIENELKEKEKSGEPREKGGLPTRERRRD